MKTTMLPEHPDAKSPAGADIRYIMGWTSEELAAIHYRNWQDFEE